MNWSRLKGNEIKVKSTKIHTSDQEILDRLREEFSEGYLRKLRNGLDPRDQPTSIWGPVKDSEVIRGLIRQAGDQLTKKDEQKKSRKTTNSRTQ
jgi:hypothetical protein